VRQGAASIYFTTTQCKKERPRKATVEHNFGHKLNIRHEVISHNAKIEVENDLRRHFYENHKFFWWECPLPEKHLVVLIAASRSMTFGPCKGGLITQHRRPDWKLNKHVRTLCYEGYLGEYGTFREFEPTLLGWATLDAFAKDRACFPEQVQRSLREFYEGTPSCSSQDPPTSAHQLADQSSVSADSSSAIAPVVPVYLPTIR